MERTLTRPAVSGNRDDGVPACSEVYRKLVSEAGCIQGAHAPSSKCLYPGRSGAERWRNESRDSQSFSPMARATQKIESFDCLLATSPRETRSG